MKSFKNKLIFWQENAVGVLSTSERALITDSEGAALALGTAGILSRFDYISTSSGLSKKMISGVTEGHSTIYWFDHERAEFNSISDGVTSVSKTKGIQSLLNFDKYRIKNKIPMSYDSKYNEVIVNIPGLIQFLSGGFLMHSENGIIMINENAGILV
jgi:hypothetical protein